MNDPVEGHMTLAEYLVSRVANASPTTGDGEQAVVLLHDSIDPVTDARCPALTQRGSLVWRERKNNSKWSINN